MMTENEIRNYERHLYLSSLFGGGMAGLFADMILFPLDTIKTRLQAAQGFQKAGGFSGVYRGIGPQFVGSIPQAALFFCTYELFKKHMKPLVSSSHYPFVYMAGGSIAEIVSCLVRVPMEVVKQRRQTNRNRSAMRIAIDAVSKEGLLKGLYRGYGSTILREVPFSFIQLPILEYFKVIYSRNFANSKELKSHQVAICGSIAGGIAAAVTTPLDVVKTRIMLADASSQRSHLKVSSMFFTIYKDRGITGLFAGFVPRVIWITLGGYIFFGMYDLSKSSCSHFLNRE